MLGSLLWLEHYGLEQVETGGKVGYYNRLQAWRKDITNFDSVLKSRGIILPTKVI